MRWSLIAVVIGCAIVVQNTYYALQPHIQMHVSRVCTSEQLIAEAGVLHRENCIRNQPHADYTNIYNLITKMIRGNTEMILYWSVVQQSSLATLATNPCFFW